jgi:hypothetical protein
LKRGGRFAIGLNRLNVKLADSLDREQAAAIIARHHGSIVGELTFAKQFYEVAVDPPRTKDTLDVAEELAAEADVEFAEPQFVEIVARR